MALGILLQIWQLKFGQNPNYQNSPTTKDRLVKKEKLNRPKCHKKEPKKGPKFESKQPKKIWHELNPVTAYPFAQSCFNQPYLPRFNSELQSV